MENIKKQFYSISILVGSIFGIIFIIALISSGLFSAKTPKIIILEPVNNSSIQASSVIIKGSVNPSHSIVSINGVSVNNKGGNFEYEFKLNNKIEANNINITATNKKKTSNVSVVVKRIFTEEEQNQIKADKLKEEQAKQEVLEKKKAELEAYYKTPAGKICKSHSGWTKEDCQNLADKKIWIGMEYDMLKYLFGLPNHANPSNYGYGTSWQWCWDNYKPSCFYDNDDDGLIDSYN